MRELEKNYSPKSIEDKIYKKWMDSDSFKAEPDKNKKPFKKTKISVYDNNNLKTIKTNDMGLLSIDLKKGTHKFRVVYNGSKNYEQTTETFTVKVS